MNYHYHVTVEAPNEPKRNWQSFIKQQLMKFGYPGYSVVSVVPIDDMDPKIAETIERDADDRGEIDL